MADQFRDIHQSYGRCLRSRDFLERFYTLLLDSSEEIRPIFATTDFGQQRRALRRGITTAILFASGSDIVSREVERMAEVHSRRGRAPVRPPLYEYWLNTLVQTVRERDPQITPALEQRWQQAMRPIIDHFRRAY